MKHLTVRSFPVPCHLVPCRSERLPQHPVLEYPAPTFFLQYERASCFRPYKTPGQIVVLYFSIRTFLNQTAKRKILDRMVADIQRVQSALNFFMNAKCKSSPVTGLEWPRGFQEVKVPRLHDNGTG